MKKGEKALYSTRMAEMKAIKSIQLAKIWNNQNFHTFLVEIVIFTVILEGK